MKKTSKRRVLFVLRVAAMVGATYFAISGISETLGQEKERDRPIYIERNNEPNVTYALEVQPTKTVIETEEAETEDTDTEEAITESLDFDSNEAYLLCKIAMAEAESEGTEGKALVMLVVLNRVWSEEFPNTIKEVILQKNQFSPVGNGRYYKVEPDAECYEALRMIQQDRWNESQGALYFESKSDSKWHSENLDFLFQYGRHYFYK